MTAAEKPLSERLREFPTYYDDRGHFGQLFEIADEIEALESERDIMKFNMRVLKLNNDSLNNFHNEALKRAKVAEAEVKKLKDAILKLNTAAIEYEEASEARLAKAQKIAKELCGNLDCDNEFIADENLCLGCKVWEIKEALGVSSEGKTGK